MQNGVLTEGDNEAYAIEVYADEAAWLAARRPAIGGSEAAAVWGLSDYDSPYSLWAKKRGLVPDDTIESEAMEIGSLVEPVVAELYTRRTGRALAHPGPYTILRSRAWPWLAVSVDRIILPSQGRHTPGVLECKNRGVGAARTWQAQVPDAVQAQVQHAIAVTGYNWGAGAAIVGGNRFLWADLDRLDVWIKLHVERCRDLHDRILAGDPPPIDGHEATAEALAAQHAHEVPGKIVRLPPEATRWTEVIEECARARKAVEQQEAEARNALRAAIGDAEVGLMPAGIGTWSLRTVEVRAHQRAASVYRKLTYKGLR